MERRRWREGGDGEREGIVRGDGEGDGERGR